MQYNGLNKPTGAEFAMTCLHLLTKPTLLSSSINYSATLLKVVKSLSSSSSINFTSNISTATLISALSHNSTLLAAYTLSQTNNFTIIIGGALILIGISLGYMINRIGDDIITVDFHLYSFNNLQNALEYKEKRITKLKKYGYTEAEINWYFNLRRNLQTLKEEVNG